MYSLLRRCKNVVLVLLAVEAGLLFPEFGSTLRPLITVIVVFLVYSSFQGMDAESSPIGSYWRLVAVFLLLSYGVLPLVGLFVINTLPSGGTRTGFAIMLAAPTTAGSAIVWTRLSDGEVQFSTVASMTSLFLAPLFTPLVLGYLLSNSVGVPTFSILTDLVVILAGGALLHLAVPEGAVSPRNINISTSVAIALLIYITISGVSVGDMSSWWLARVLLISGLLLLTGISFVLLIKYVLKLTLSKAISLFFTINLKNLGIAVLVSVSYTEPLVVTTIVFYYVFQQVVSAAVSDLNIGNAQM